MSDEMRNREGAFRMYSITDAGNAYLSLWAERCEGYQRVLDSFYLSLRNRGESAKFA
jgi:DNA-binding PadR family transcriptional regulator